MKSGPAEEDIKMKLNQIRFWISFQIRFQENQLNCYINSPDEKHPIIDQIRFKTDLFYFINFKLI